ncbi:hypothetical protein LJC48_00825 [Desulfovibrio sp. OttesenSCG-928-C06]|nr:hypothetical protein [Desulfovibrio sp. OttesenSCG-928-C06]
MSKENKLAEVSSNAIVPEQLLHYVNLVSDVKSKIVGQCLVHFNDDVAIVIGFPLDGREEQLSPSVLSRTLDELSSRKDLQRISVLAPFRPASAPEWATCFTNAYLCVPLPFTNERPKGFYGLLAAKPKTGMPVEIEKWTKEHEKIAKEFTHMRNLSAGSKQMFEGLEDYLEANPGTRLFTTRNDNGQLMGCLVGDFTSKETAFYMLAFEAPTAPPQASDSLMRAFIDEAGKQGKKRMVLGLQVDRTLTQRYKDKWGATEFCPLVQTTWEVNESGKAQARAYKNEMSKRAANLRNEPLLFKLKRWIGL